MELKYKVRKSKQQKKPILHRGQETLLRVGIQSLFRLRNIIRFALLYINYRLVETELSKEAIRVVPIEIGDTHYNFPILVLLLFPILLNMGLTEILIKKLSKGEKNVYLQR